MRILKKSLALILAFAILASLVVVNVSAADDAKVYIGSKTVLRLAQDQEVTVPVFIRTTENTSVNAISFVLDYDTDALTLDSIEFKAADLVNVSAVDVKTIAGVDFMAVNRPYSYDDADVTDDEAANLALLTFTVAANAPAGDYAVSGILDSDNTTHAFTSGDPTSNVSVADQFAVVNGNVTVIEKQYINAAAEYTVDEAIEYGANAPALPETIKGLGKTSNEVDITAETGIDLDVDWEDINTLQIPGEYTIEGIVAEPVSDTIEFKSEDYAEDVDSLTAIANYEISKSTEGVVAPVEIEVEARLGGEAAEVAGVIALKEVAAVTATTIAIVGGETEEVELNWEAAELYDEDDATLNLGVAGDSIVLNVPLAGTATYYDLDDKVAAVTITVVEAVKLYNEIEAVTVETEVEYGATEGPALPDKVKGSGKTVGGQEFDAEYSDEFDVEWDDVDTFVAPGNYTVNGTVDEPADDLISFKNADYTADVDTLTATANYKIAKSTKGVVAPVANIDVRAKDAGTDADVAAIIALDEIKAVTNTTIAIEGGETETVTLNWAEAEAADAADATLDLGSDSDSIVLNVPVTGDTTYYNLEGKIVTVTVQMTPAWDYGDVDHSGTVTFTDAQLTAKYAVMGAVEGIFDARLANVDGSATAVKNGITFTDAQLIAKKAVNASYTFPVEL